MEKFKFNDYLDRVKTNQFYNRISKDKKQTINHVKSLLTIDSNNIIDKDHNDDFDLDQAWFFITNFNNPNNPLSALIRVTNNVTNELIIFPVNHLIAKYNGSFQEFIVPMVHNVWLNGRNYTQMRVEYFKNVLKNVTQIEILGDWTRGNETMGLDNIMIG